LHGAVISTLFPYTTLFRSQLLISHYLANRLNLKVGDDLIMSFVQENRTRKRKFLIQGIYRTNSDDWDKNYVVGSIEVIRRLNQLDRKSTRLNSSHVKISYA